MFDSAPNTSLWKATKFEMQQATSYSAKFRVPECSKSAKIWKFL